MFDSPHHSNGQSAGKPKAPPGYSLQRVSALAGAIRTKLGSDRYSLGEGPGQNDDCDLSQASFNTRTCRDVKDSNLVVLLKDLRYREIEALSLYFEKGFSESQVCKLMRLEPLAFSILWSKVVTAYVNDPHYSASFTLFLKEISQQAATGWLKEFIEAQGRLPDKTTDALQHDQSRALLYATYMPRVFELFEKYVDGPGFVGRFMYDHHQEPAKKKAPSEAKNSEDEDCKPCAKKNGTTSKVVKDQEDTAVLQLRRDFFFFRSELFFPIDARFAVDNPLCGAATKAAIESWLKVKYSASKEPQPDGSSMIVVGLHPASFSIESGILSPAALFKERLIHLGIIACRKK